MDVHLDEEPQSALHQIHYFFSIVSEKAVGKVANESKAQGTKYCNSPNHFLKLAKKKEREKRTTAETIPASKCILHGARNICFGFGVKKEFTA